MLGCLVALYCALVVVVVDNVAHFLAPAIDGPVVSIEGCGVAEEHL